MITRLVIEADLHLSLKWPALVAFAAFTPNDSMASFFSKSIG